MLRRTFTFAAAAVAALLVAAAPAAAAFSPGAAGAGDPFFPLAGNGGYHVRHYALELDYDRGTNFLEGAALIKATATQDLSRFNLDLRPFMEVRKLQVNGRSVAFSREGEHELVVNPSFGIRDGARFNVMVHYSGEPQAIVDPDESIEGWVPTHDGAFVVNEPQGSPGWYPVNDTPRDKATYEFEVTVPTGREAIANGVLVGHEDDGEKATWRWDENNPMAPYLATATNGEFDTRFREILGGLPEYNAVDPTTRLFGQTAPNPQLAWDRLDAHQPAAVQVFSEVYGPYPFEAIGAIVDYAPNVFYHLESQTKANYWVVPGVSTIVHEVAHQWVGNAVTPETWNDIWLNEGFARWSEWIYTERTSGQSAQTTFNTQYATPATNTAFWNPPPGDPGGPEHMFDGTVYARGAMTIQALRQKIADDDVFFGILRAWYAENRNSNVTTADFIALVKRESDIPDAELDNFFQVWLYTPGKPATW